MGVSLQSSFEMHFEKYVVDLNGLNSFVYVSRSILIPDENIGKMFNLKMYTRHPRMKKF